MAGMTRGEAKNDKVGARRRTGVSGERALRGAGKKRGRTRRPPERKGKAGFYQRKKLPTAKTSASCVAPSNHSCSTLLYSAITLNQEVTSW